MQPVYIDPPQTTRVMINGAGANYNLTTWHGISDFSTLTSAQVRADILLCLHDRRITLRAANVVNLNNVQIDDTSIIETIQAKILKLSFKQKICASVLQQLCPGHSDQPHAAIEHIRQSANGPDIQLITTTTINYQRMLNTSCLRSCHS